MRGTEFDREGTGGNHSEGEMSSVLFGPGVGSYVPRTVDTRAGDTKGLHLVRRRLVSVGSRQGFYLVTYLSLSIYLSTYLFFPVYFTQFLINEVLKSLNKTIYSSQSLPRCLLSYTNTKSFFFSL